MRKFHKQQILEIIKSLHIATEAVLYADCQETALSLCDYIEELAGEGAEAIILLEEYAELLFKATNGDVGLKQLQKQLIKIENSIKNNLPITKIEVAFLSYKASMSDSLESIYFAAEADPSCDAYFIPIPYYDRLPGGELGQMYYEGEEHYSDKIKVTHYTNYDIESRRPDVIFNFNPYDGINLVTSVHPDYYSEKLRSFTDMLVYIPYFLTGAVREAFIDTPGVIYSHKVILWSELVRQQHVKVLKGKYGNDIGSLQDKLVVIGSPKIDKAINSVKSDFTLPSDWECILGGKKAVLYNTSIGAMLAGGGDHIKKIKQALETFKSNKDVVLWWRPHPLLGTSYKTMRPKLLQEYNNILEDYRGQSWGILDETPDLYRAIMYTDAIYGDGSSINGSYLVQGKPIMKQNVSVGYDSALTGFPKDVFPKSVQEMKERSDYVYRESDEVRLTDYLEYVFKRHTFAKEDERENEQKQMAKEAFTNTEGTAGVKIYEYVKSLARS